MLTSETINSCPKEDILALTPTLEANDIDLLVSWLSETDDNFRYKCFLLLLDRSQKYPDVYPYWDTFVEKLSSTNSFQRNIGLNLIAENARWDDLGKFDQVVNLYLSCIHDEKPITIRQCIQGLCKIVPCKPDCRTQITNALLSMDLSQIRETMRKVILLDILSVLIEIHKFSPDPRVDQYIQSTLTGSLLDSKSKRQITSLLA